MSRKSFNICVVFDILDVTCPGVCICPKGMVYLEICLFGYNSSTSFVEPKFPLVFNETFSFHENFAKAFDLRGVQKCLEDKYVQITLTQVYKNKQVTLAIYNSNVDEMLYPERNHSNKNGKTALFMKNEPLFPGTISPKITVITKTSVTEQIHTILQNNHCSSQSLETQCWPNRMKRVHHSKQMNSECFNKIDHRLYTEN
ncbi:Spermatogenesis-associated protein 6, N-terminal [Cinara cedri]|uniref:Spermatogenesis-associated protein 6, N-terminal n=1 Tax=Cinara cedri TaxID=506608 RepID=A0A5E4NFH4_9HEMI|nr:Spermatogenesis-associated protein 6, N-terminal [Cinara cedri]